MKDYYDPRANWSLIPPHMHDGIYRYVMQGEPVGGFLTSLLSGESLLDVAARADRENLRALGGWAEFLYNHVPGICHRSPERVEEWQNGGGWLGRHPSDE